jgi:hypothetical protein
MREDDRDRRRDCGVLEVFPEAAGLHHPMLLSRETLEVGEELPIARGELGLVPPMTESVNGDGDNGVPVDV